MQKFLYILIFVLTVQGVFAQERTTSTVYLRNGSIVKGKVLRSRSSDNVKVETPDGSTVFFTNNTIKEIVREAYTLSKTVPVNTVYLTNGSIIHGKVTKNSNTGRMRVTTASGCSVFFTEQSIKKIVPYGEDALEDDLFAGTTSRQSPQASGTDARQPQQSPQPLPEPEKTSGYRGILEAGYTMKMGEISTSRIEVTTSHGFQMNNRLFIGVGFGVNLYSDGLYYNPSAPAAALGVDTVNMSMTFPVFADLRVNFIDKGSVIPFAGLKAGYSMGILASEFTKIEGNETRYRKETKLEGVGFYLQPSVGVKFMLGKSAALNLSVGYACQTFKHYYQPIENNPNNAIFKKDKNNGGVNFRIGLEF